MTTKADTLTAPFAALSDAQSAASEFVAVPAEWNATEAPYPVGACIHHLMEAQVERSPAAVALVWEEQELTYAELNRRANQLAHYLRGLGVGAETLVGICCNRTPDMVIGMLGILKAGGAYVALDPAYPKVRQAFMIEDARMPILLTQQELVDALPSTQAKLICLDSDWGAIDQSPDTNPAAPVEQSNLAYILYTSGSTGRPKGVAIEHHSVVVFLSWAQTVFTPAELAGTLAATSICFDLSVFEIFLPLTCGGSIVLADNAVALPTLPARNRVTLINTVPSAMSALVNVGGVPASVRVVNLAGEPLPNKLVQEIYQQDTVEKVFNLYGPSEDTTYSTYVLCEKGATKNPTIGKPINNTQAYIVDEQMHAAALGVAGELCLGGDGLARGYLNRPDLTDAKFIANPFGPGRLYRTGDLARYLPDGNIEFLGRMDYQVKVRGYRIELGEVETAIEQHPAVDRAVVLALPDARGDLQLVGYMAPKSAAVEELAHSQDSREHVDLWKNVYEETYRQTPTPTDLTFNTSGWHSSYTGRPFQVEEMKEWLAQTIDRILALKPNRVLEIGCGTGLLLARVAPHCSSYVGLDFSRTALEHIRTMQQSVPGLANVELYERSADELHDFPSQSFDTIVINSVVQHFPDVDYLLNVIKGATRLVKSGGHIFIGDVLNLSLLETFHTSIQMFRAADDDTSADLRRRIRQQVSQERDLMLAPGFFTTVAQQEPSITHVEIVPKRGRFHNQLTRFRYEAILHIGGDANLARDLSWTDWQRQKLTVGEVRNRLRTERPERLAFRNIPNARLDAECAAVPWLKESGPAETIAALRSYVSQQPKRGVDPEDLWALAAEAGYRAELSWLNTDSQGLLDAVFTRNDVASQPSSFATDRPADVKRRTVSDYANYPQRAKLNKQLIPQVRQFLEEKLPYYMMPAVFTVLDELPLSPTGKIDRRALSQLPVTIETPEDDTAPVTLTPLERMLSDAWADALNLSHVRLDDDFFAMGGNSLKAMALTHRLQRQLDITLRPLTLMHSPTIAQFSKYLADTYADIASRLAASSALSLAAAAGGGAEAAMEEGDI